MKKLTNEDKRILSKFLNEERHYYSIVDNQLSACSCGLKGHIVRDSCTKMNRDFDTPDDMFAIKNKLVRKKMFDKIYIFSLRYWAKDPRRAEYYEWIFNPKVFNKIVADFIRETN